MRSRIQYVLLALMAVTHAFSAFGQSDPGSAGCPLVLNPTITYASSEEDCVVGITADAGSDCLEILDYSWAVNGGVSQSTGTNPLFLYETMNNINTLAVKIRATNGTTIIEETEIFDLSNETCASTSSSTGALTANKEANRVGSPFNLDAVYLGATIEWKITMTSEVTQTIEYQEFAEVSGYVGFDAMGNPIGAPVECPFVNVNDPVFMMPGKLINPDGSEMGIPLSGCIDVQQGTSVFVFRYQTCDEPAFSNMNAFWKNCFQYTPGCFAPGPGGISATSNPTEEACDIMFTIYGCPGGMTDGFCMPEEDLEADDPIVSALNMKQGFPDVYTMEGRIEYPISKLYNGQLTLSPDFPATWSMQTTDNGDGTIEFFISSSNPLETVTLGSQGIKYPVEFQGLLIDNLSENCVSIHLDDYYVTSVDAPAGFQIWTDPGVFCIDFENSDPPYDPVNIILDPFTTTCITPGQPVTLTADGPYDESNPNTTFTWTPGGAETPSITVTTPGTYTVTVNDERGCIRQNQITLVSCEPECSCETLDVTIDAEIEGCEATFTLNLPDCSNATFVSYEWTFSNGNTYSGQNPPTQNFAGPVIIPGPDALVKVTSIIDGEVCEKPFEKDITVICYGPSKMYPNPSSGTLNVDLSPTGISKGQIQIFNMMGLKSVDLPFNVEGSAMVQTLDVSNLKSGIYFVRILDENGKLLETKRLIVE